MIRHLLQIFFTLGLTFNVLSPLTPAIPVQVVLLVRGTAA